MILSAGQGKTEYFLEVWNGENSGFSGEEWMGSTWMLLSAFSGVGLLPFALDKVEKQGSARKPLISGLLTVCGVVLGMQILLPAVFGRERLFTEVYPILPLLDGADLPGNVLARFDVIWMGFLVFGLFFLWEVCFIMGTRSRPERSWEPGDTGSLRQAGFFPYIIGMVTESEIIMAVILDMFCAGTSCDTATSGHGKPRTQRKKVAAAALFLAVCLTGTGCAAVDRKKESIHLLWEQELWSRGLC